MIENVAAFFWTQFRRNLLPILVTAVVRSEETDKNSELLFRIEQDLSG
jgi:hypothetical protein